VPEAIRGGVRNNAGGHSNHAFFWTIMGAGQGRRAQGQARGGHHRHVGLDFDKFKAEFAKAAATRFGSGWAWLIVTRRDKKAQSAYAPPPNQDNPLMKGRRRMHRKSGTPILGLDVWEHAYYLNYQNRRPDYVAAWWNVVNWDAAEKNYLAALA
jgi:Fe-Mn family superoxide dismutase